MQICKYVCCLIFSSLKEKQLFRNSRLCLGINGLLSFLSFSEYLQNWIDSLLLYAVSLPILFFICARYNNAEYV